VKVLRGTLFATMTVMLATSPAVAAETISISGSAFIGGVRTASLGERVTWENADGLTHTSSGRRPLAAWSLSIPGGSSKGRRFKQAGAFPYLCTIHPSMTGSIKVPVRVTPASAGPGQVITVRVATVNAPSGFVYVVQRRPPGGSFQAWKTITGQTTTFASNTKGTWAFRAKLRRVGAGDSGFSPIDTVTIS
jgi:plastocyanin